MPKFVIFDPTEVPTTPGELSAIVAQKVTEISNNLKDFIESEKKTRAAEKLATSMNQLVSTGQAFLCSYPQEAPLRP